MNPHALVILRGNDSRTDFEFPRGFDWQAAMAEVRALKGEFASILGEHLSLDDQVQDASFFADLFVLDDEVTVQNSVKFRGIKIAIRFSAFGRMATISTTSATSELCDFPLDRLVNLLERNHYCYVSADDLDEPYDGAGDWPASGPRTWWGRFFDYL